MPLKEKPNTGITYVQSFASLFGKAYELNVLVESLHSVFNSTNITDLNSYKVRQLKRISRVVETFISIVLRKEDLISAHSILRCIVDSTVVLFLLYDKDDQEEILLRHYLYILDANDERNKVVGNPDLDGCPVIIQKEVRTPYEFSKENFERTELLCESKIKELSIYKENTSDIDSLIKKRQWKYINMSAHEKNIKWEQLYENFPKIVLAKYTGFLSQDVHNLAFSVENLDTSARDFVGDIMYASYLCEQLINFIERRMTDLWLPKVQEYYEKITSK